MNSKSLFIATPISAFSSDEEYMKFRDWLTSLTQKISESGEFSKVFCVACIVKSQGALDDPIDSLVGDIAELDKASHFLLLYPVSTPTSALIELGYALAKNKKITIAHPRKVALPFMAKKLNKVYNNILKVVFEGFDEKAIVEVLRALDIDDITKP